jgi:cystathionine beta-lyase/cystathionine gamma-synthase
MLSFIVAGEPEVALRRATKVCERLRLIELAVSLGGTESLIEHPASMTHAMIPREDRLKGGLPDGLVRISVGLESMHDLVADLQQSLDRCDED